MLTRRDTLKVLGAGATGFQARGKTAPPNIVIFLADDLGYGDLGFTGCPDVKTPSLDRLSQQSMMFTHAYCNGPVCSPTRTALLTGQYQQRNGMDQVILVRERERGLDTRATLLPQILKPAGYATAIIGKWHLGFQPQFLPTRRGFDEFKGFLAGNIDYFAHIDRRNEPDLWDGEKPLRDERYMTDFIAEESMRFIDRNAGKHPFFLYAAFNAVHDPFQGPGDRDTAGNFQLSAKRNRNRTVYRAMIESLDRNVGRILSRLDAAKQAADTLVFFMSDNGGVPEIGRNLPFRGHKGQLWEGGIRTPFLVRWPGRIRGGTRYTDPVAGFDILPTCARAAGVAVPASLKIDGVSLLNACLGKERVKRAGIYFRSGSQRALVQGKFKYLRDPEGVDRMYNLDFDPGEQNDLAATRADDMRRLKSAYQTWLMDVYGGNPPAE